MQSSADVGWPAWGIQAGVQPQTDQLSTVCGRPSLHTPQGPGRLMGVPGQRYEQSMPMPDVMHKLQLTPKHWQGSRTSGVDYQESAAAEACRR